MSVRDYSETEWNSDAIGNKREHPGDDSEGKKKARTGDNASKVVHIRGLPSVVSDSEVRELGQPFGNVVKHLLMLSKGQAFVEFENIEQAQAMIDGYEYNKVNLQNQDVRVQFSSHQELKIKDRQDNESSSGNTSVEAPSKVVHIRRLPQVYNDDEIRDLGLPFGRMTNHLIMRSRGQAFIEFENVDCAKTMMNYFAYAKPTIRNQTVFIQYSSHQELKTRDLPPTNQDNYPPQQLKQEASSYSEESVPMPKGPPRIVKVTVTNIKYPVTLEVLEKVFQRCGKIQKIVTFMQSDQFHALIQYGTPEEAVTAKSLLDWQNIYTGCNTLNVTFSKLEQLHVKFNNDKMRDYTNPDLPSGEQNTLKFGGVLPTPTADELRFQNPASNARGDFEAKLAAMLQLAAQSQQLPNNFRPRDNYQDGGNYLRHNSHQDSHRGGSNSYSTPLQAAPLQPGATVLLCSNLNEEAVTCDDLFTLFGVYGDVMRVKILFNKKDHALIQLADPSMASNALEHLSNAILHGKAIHIAPSKHASITGPKSNAVDDTEANLTKDYSDSPLHRFRRSRGKNFQNIFMPIKTLHLANISEDSGEEDIRKMFGEHGTVADFKFFHNDNRQAMLQMADVEQAILTLIRCHNQNHIKVSFAKKEMS